MLFILPRLPSKYILFVSVYPGHSDLQFVVDIQGKGVVLGNNTQVIIHREYHLF